jgi:hypothetical protein
MNRLGIIVDLSHSSIQVIPFYYYYKESLFLVTLSLFWPYNEIKKKTKKLEICNFIMNSIPKDVSE